MARRGRFGRIPRTSTDISSTVVAMAREFQNMRDRNIVNSWENGGKFEGKKVTDSMLLSFWKGRRGEVAKGDPLWDQYDQTVSQYEFAISNSKMELGYAQGKKSPSQMAAFYRGAAGKLPENSEAWRKMMQLAAQYKDRAISAGRGGRRARSDGAYNSAQNAIYNKNEAAYDAILNAVNVLAHREGILNTAKEDLSDLRVVEGDAGRLTALFDTINKDPAYANWRTQFTAAIKQVDPTFNGDFSYESFISRGKRKEAGLIDRFMTASRTGHKADAKRFKKDLDKASGVHNSITAAQPLERYESSRKHYQMVADDPNSDPVDLWQASQAHLGNMRTIVSEFDRYLGGNPAGMDPQMATLRGHAWNELQALEGKDVNAPTLWDDSRGAEAAASQPGKGDASSTARDIMQLQKDLQDLATGKAYIARVDSNGQPSTDPNAQYKTVPRDLVINDPYKFFVPAQGASEATIDVPGVGPMQTGSILTAVMGQPVYVRSSVGQPNRFGQQTTFGKAAGEAVGIRAAMPDGSTVFSYWDDNGTQRFTTSNPFRDGQDGPLHQLDETPEGVFITLAPKNVRAPNAAPVTDINSALDPSMYNHATADTMATTVFRSSYSAWLAGGSKSSQQAFTMDPNVVATAIIEETRMSARGKEGGQLRTDFAAAIREADQMRLDYLNDTPDAQRRLREAAARQFTPTLADQHGVSEENTAYDAMVRAAMNEQPAGPDERNQTNARIRGLVQSEIIKGRAAAFDSLAGLTPGQRRLEKQDLLQQRASTVLGAKPPIPTQTAFAKERDWQGPGSQFTTSVRGMVGGAMNTIAQASIAPRTVAPVRPVGGRVGGLGAPGVAAPPALRTPQPKAPPPIKAPPPEPAANAPAFNPNYVQTPTPKPTTDTRGDYVIINGKKQYL